MCQGQKSLRTTDQVQPPILKIIRVEETEALKR